MGKIWRQKLEVFSQPSFTKEEEKSDSKAERLQWIVDNEGIAECLVQYYQTLLSSENQQFCASATDSIQTVIAEEMNAKLSSEFTQL